jgi:3-oxoadipate enol-lactonase
MAQELDALLPDSQLIVMPGCAHVPQLQDTDGFISEIGSFLE